MGKEFRSFVLRGNVIDLAIAVVIGVAFGAVVTQFVASFVTPLIAAIGGKPDFSALAFEINGSKFTYGEFFNVLLAFLIIAAVIFFFVVRPMSKMMDRLGLGPKPEAPTKACTECLSDIPAEARRCLFCTSPQT